MKENPWPERRQGLVAALQLHASSTGIICLQEVLHGQLQDISALLNEGHHSGSGSSSSNTTTDNDNDNPRQISNNTSSDPAKKWEYVGVGRDDGATKGEYSPIFYNTEIHDLISWRCFWLSETPDRPGKGWDAASVRICTVGRFGFRGSGTHDFTIMVRTTPSTCISNSVFSSFASYCFSLLFVVFMSLFSTLVILQFPRPQSLCSWYAIWLSFSCSLANLFFSLVNPLRRPRRPIKRKARSPPSRSN